MTKAPHMRVAAIIRRTPLRGSIYSIHIRRIFIVFKNAGNY
jgi:hypothetical protein